MKKRNHIKRNRIIYIALSGVFALVSLVSMTAAAQQNGITVSGVTMTSASEGPRLEMTVTITSNAVTNLQSIAVVPTLSDWSGNSATFPYVLVNGKNRSQMYERQKKLKGEELGQNPPYLVMNIDSKHPGGKVDYSAWVTGEDWMRDASLSLAFVLVSPAGETQSYSTAVSGTSVVTIPEAATVSSQPTVVDTPPAFADIQPPTAQIPPPVYSTPPTTAQTPPTYTQTPPPPVYSTPPTTAQTPPTYTQTPPPPVYSTPPTQTQPVYGEPQPAYQPPYTPTGPVRTLSGTANLDFAAASSQLQPTLGRNPQELAGVEALIGQITSYPGASIVSVTITGYSSVDGRFETNASLAYDRAMGLSRYMQERFGISSSIVNIRAVGEDWSGLRAAVAASSLPYVGEILKVIDGTQPPDAKESLLRRMMGGQIWRRIESDILPGLRKVDYSIDYQTAE